ncbi:hypothetical protein C8Q74DRAFT_728401 [Fomes fomentarius]|nr:hypothetical protein C8Q74DRAFT_728401 [Fomes fomentarius]
MCGAAALTTHTRKEDTIHFTSHRDGKGRVSDWMRSQRSMVIDIDMSWAVLLSDIGFFARYIFDHREATSGQQLQDCWRPGHRLEVGYLLDQALQTRHVRLLHSSIVSMIKML